MKSDARNPPTRLWLWLWLALSLALAAGLRYMTHLPGSSHGGSLPPLTEEEAELRERLRKRVAMLAGEIGERNLWRHAALDASADYIEKTFQAAGYEVASQHHTVHGKTVGNLDAALPGTSPSAEIVVIGAHYDSVVGSPGANDNASGVAALLEIARLLARQRPVRSLRFVAFVNEEPPFFYTQDMGSRVYARRARERGENIVAMLSLETIGYYTDAKGSQHYPFPFSPFYPDTANFRRLCRRSRLTRRGAGVPGVLSQSGSLPRRGHCRARVDGGRPLVGSLEGYPAIMVTDTALYRYEHYHAQTDTPDKIDYERLARVVAGLARVTRDLAAKAGEEQPARKQGPVR